MSFMLNESQWNNIKQNYSKWWAGNLERPILPVILTGVESKRKKPNISLLNQKNSMDFSITPEQIIDRYDYELSTKKYIGDAYPVFGMECFGPGVLAALLGCDIDISTEHIWFGCHNPLELKDMHFTYNPNSQLFEHIINIYKAAVKRWGGEVVMGMLDLGGVLDVLASFRTTERLLMDLYDEPEEVKRVTKEINDVWIKYYNEVNNIISGNVKGYCDWAGIFSETPNYTVQCDFAYMLSTDMFVEFVKDILVLQTEMIPNTMYHLDGKGQLPHLDEILAMPNLNAVQWVPGEGSLGQAHWPELYNKISKAGKGIQIYEGFNTVDIIAKQIGTNSGILTMPMYYDISQEYEMLKKLETYGVYCW